MLGYKNAFPIRLAVMLVQQKGRESGLAQKSGTRPAADVSACGLH